jgi:hypothetical protein
MGGTDPIPFLGTTMPWAYITSDDVGWETDGQGDLTAITHGKTIDCYAVALSDNSADYFDYDVEAGAGQYGDDRVFLLLKQPGIYAITHSLETSDLDSTTPLFRIQVDIDVALSASPSYPGAGKFFTPSRIRYLEQHYIGEDGADDLHFVRTWVLPLRHTSPGTGIPFGDTNIFYPPTPASDEFWNHDLYVVRLGDLEWSRTFAFADFTWNYVNGAHA